MRVSISKHYQEIMDRDNFVTMHIANIESLICLKSKAFLDLSQMKAIGESVDSKHIAKHKKDIFRLAAMLTPARRTFEKFVNSLDGFRQRVESQYAGTVYPVGSTLGGWIPSFSYQSMRGAVCV